MKQDGFGLGSSILISMRPIESLFWALVFYFLPSIVAYARRSGWRPLALFVNAFFGWTIVGWFVAWFLAFHKADDPAY